MSRINSFADAFYVIAIELGIDYTQPLSPKEMLEDCIIPRIRKLVSDEVNKSEIVLPDPEIVAYQIEVLNPQGTLCYIYKNTIPSREEIKENYGIFARIGSIEKLIYYRS